MIVGILQLELEIAGAGSLKDKRRVVRAVKDRLHREHRVGVAEVARQDVLSVAVLGVAACGGEPGPLNKTFDLITEKLRGRLGGHLDADLAGVTRRLVRLRDLPPAPAPTEEEKRALADELLAYADDIDAEPADGAAAREDDA